MKRYLSLLLLLCIAVSMLCGCSSDKEVVYLWATTPVTEAPPTTELQVTEAPPATENPADKYADIGFNNLGEYSTLISVDSSRFSLKNLLYTDIYATKRMTYNSYSRIATCDFFCAGTANDAAVPFNIISNDCIVVYWAQARPKVGNTGETSTIKIAKRHNINGVLVFEDIDGDYLIPTYFLRYVEKRELNESFGKRIVYVVKDEYKR